MTGLRGFLARAIHRDLSDRGWWLVSLMMAAATAALVSVATVYDAVVLRPLPVTTAPRIVSIGGLPFGGMPRPVEWWSRASGLERLSLYSTGDAELVTSDHDQLWVRLAEVSGDFFGVFGNPIDLGRTFSLEEAENNHVAVVSMALWRRISHGRGIESEVSVRVGGVSATVIGVTKAGFGFPSAAQLWLPRVSTESSRPVTVTGINGLPPVRTDAAWLGLVRGNSTVGAVAEQLHALVENANATLRPKTKVSYGSVVGVVPLTDLLVQGVRPALRVVLLATSSLYFLCLTNTVVFVLLRVHEKRRDRALRVSLGASSSRLLLEDLSETAPLLFACMLGGAVMAVMLVGTARHYLYGYRVYVPADGQIWLASLAIFITASVALMVAAAIPAWLTSRNLNLSYLLHADSRGGIPRHHLVFRRILVAGSAAVASLMVAGALVATQSLHGLMNVSLGFREEALLSIHVSFLRSEIEGNIFAQRRRQMLNAVAGVFQSLATSNGPPLLSSEERFVQVEANGQNRMVVDIQADGEFFETLGVAVQGGPLDGGANEVAVNQSLAATLWPDETALGKPVRVGGQSFVVVAVSPDLRPIDQKEGRRFELYRPFVEMDGTLPNLRASFQLLARCKQTCGNPSQVIAALRQVPGIQVNRVEEISDRRRSLLGPQIVAAGVWSMFGFLSFVVAIFGTATIVAFGAKRRRIEMGLRAALGAPPLNLLKLLALEGIGVLCVGASVGASVGVLGAKTLAAFAPGIQIPGVLQLLSSLVVLAGAGTVAASIPAYFASRRDVNLLLQDK